MEMDSVIQAETEAVESGWVARGPVGTREVVVEVTTRTMKMARAQVEEAMAEMMPDADGGYSHIPHRMCPEHSRDVRIPGRTA